MGASRASSGVIFIALLCSLEVHAAKAKLDFMKQHRLDHDDDGDISSEVTTQNGYGLCKPCQDYAIKVLEKESKENGVTLKTAQESFPSKVATETKNDPNNPYVLLGLDQQKMAKLSRGTFFTKVSRAFLTKVDGKVSKTKKAQLEAARDLLHDAKKRAAYDMAGPSGVPLVQKVVKIEPKLVVDGEPDEHVSEVGQTQERFSETGRHLRTEEPCTISLVISVIGFVVMAASKANAAVEHMQLPEMRPLADALEYSQSTMRATKGVLDRLEKNPKWKSAPSSRALGEMARKIARQLDALGDKIEEVKEAVKMGDPNNPERYNEGESNWHRFDWKSIATLGIGNIVVACAINSNDQVWQQKALAEKQRIRDMSNLARAAANELNHAFTQSLLTR